MKIKDGRNSSEFLIQIDGYRSHCEVWTSNYGKAPKADNLHYATLEEIIALRDECNEAIAIMAGIDKEGGAR